MTSDSATSHADFDYVSPISLPPEGRIPDAETGAATPGEYDNYFRIVRDRGHLLAWSRSCLTLTETLLQDLPGSELAEQEQRDILSGFVVMLQLTLERWVSGAEAGTDGKE